MGEEVVLPFPAPRDRVPVTTLVRSTLLTASQKSLREHGHYDRYAALIAPAYRETLLVLTAGVWLPVDVAAAHYDTCQRLDLPPSEIIAIGAEVEKNTERTFLTFLTRAAHEAGATPWLPLSQIMRLWARVFVGSAVAVYKTGPKDARIEVGGWPLSTNAYMRTAVRGIIPSILELFCKKSYAREVPELLSPLTCAWRVQWV